SITVCSPERSFETYTIGPRARHADNAAKKPIHAEVRRIAFITAACRGSSPQRVEVGRDVADVLFRDSHLRHRDVPIRPVRARDEVHQVFRRVDPLARDVNATGDVVEWRADEAVSPAHAGDRVTGGASEPADRRRTAVRGGSGP